MKRLVGSLASIAALLALTAPASPDTMARVRGRVMDAITNAPIAAKISVRDSGGRTVSLKTDSHGRFAAVGFSPGNVTVSFAADGFVSQGRTCRVPPGETGRFDFRGYHDYVAASRLKYSCSIEPPTVDRSLIQ